jgi:hypothetical protein
MNMAETVGWDGDGLKPTAGCFVSLTLVQERHQEVMLVDIPG